MNEDELWGRIFNKDLLISYMVLGVLLGSAFFMGFIYKESQETTLFCQYHLKDVQYDVRITIFGTRADNYSNYTIVDWINNGR